MDREAILELAREAKAQRLSLESFVRECMRRGRTHRTSWGGADLKPLPTLSGTGAPGPGKPGIPGMAGRPPIEFSPDFFPVLAGRQLTHTGRLLEVMTDFLWALKRTGYASGLRAMTVVLKEAKFTAGVVSTVAFCTYTLVVCVAIEPVYQLSPDRIAGNLLVAANMGILVVEIVFIVVLVIFILGGEASERLPSDQVAWLRGRIPNNPAVTTSVSWFLVAGIAINVIATIMLIVIPGTALAPILADAWVQAGRTAVCTATVLVAYC